MTKGILSLLLLSLVSIACLSTLPVEPAPAVVKGVSTPVVIYTSTPAELIREVCLTADAVNLRTGAGTGFELVTVLSAGDRLTLTGDFEKSPDGGIWWPVRAGELDGFINARYVCEV